MKSKSFQGNIRNNQKYQHSFKASVVGQSNLTNVAGGSSNVIGGHSSVIGSPSNIIGSPSNVIGGHSSVIGL